MIKAITIDDHVDNAEFAAMPLRHAGIRTDTALVPIDWTALLAKEPDILVITLYRREEAFDRPIGDPAKDVLGFEALKEVEGYPAVQLLPILLIGQGVREADIPTAMRYDLFLGFPRELGLYVPKVMELATKARSSRKVSPLLCPCCRSHLVELKAKLETLFCLRCHTTVNLLGGDRISYAPQGGYSSVAGTRSQLAADPKAATS